MLEYEKEDAVTILIDGWHPLLLCSFQGEQTLPYPTPIRPYTKRRDFVERKNRLFFIRL